MTDDIHDLKQRLDPYSVVSQYGHVPNPQQGRKIRCPNHRHQQTGDTPPCSMDYNTGLWKCWGGCGAQGDLLDFIGYSLFSDYDHEHRGKRWREVVDLLATSPVQRMSAPERQQRRALNQPVLQTADVDPAWLPDWTDNLLGDRLLLDYLRQRGVDRSVVTHQLGYTSTDSRVEAKYHHKIVVPHFYRGVFTGFKAKANPFREGGKLRFISMGHFPAPYNTDSLFRAGVHTAWIVESELDARAGEELRPGDAWLARPAGSFTEDDCDLLWNIPFVRVVIDNDDAGRKQFQRIKGWINRAGLVKPPDDVKDLGEWIEAIGHGIQPYWLR